MSETCDHPFCTRPITQKCSSHCQLDLCDEHAIEHKNLFLAQYEKSFSNLSKSLRQFIATIKERKTALIRDHEQEIALIEERFDEKRSEVEEKSQLIVTTQKLIEKKVRLLSDAKLDQALLHQCDIEQVKLYLGKIQEYPVEHTATRSEEASSVNASFEYEHTDVDEEVEEEEEEDEDDDDNDDEIRYPRFSPKAKRRRPMQYRGRCPLTRFGVYGFEKNHHLRLCSATRASDDRQLCSHFHNYHRLTYSVSYRLAKAMMNGLDPLTTNILAADEKIIDQRYDIIDCPLDKVKIAPCKSKFSRCSLKMHLMNVHQLTLETSNRIVETFRAQGDLAGLELDTDEFE